MSDVESYFGPVETDNKTNYIPPDYSDETTIEVEEGFDDSPTEEDEGVIENIVVKKKKGKK